MLLVVMAGVASCSALSARMSPGCARLTLRGGTEDLRKELEFTYSTTEPNAIDELLADVEKERPQSNDGAEAAAVSVRFGRQMPVHALSPPHQFHRAAP